MRLLAALLVLVLAGCAAETDVAAPALEGPIFAAPILIDDVRAGGEPVIAILHSGTILVAAHPGATHYHPSDGAHVPIEFLSPTSGQSYLWRSTDGGATWAHIGLPTVETGPRSTGLGVSDPEFTVMADGTVCYTDLEALASASVSCSQDDGLTWLPGNPVASGGVVDRQWLASHGDELYFTANYFVDHHLRASTDKGLTWENRGDVPCGQDLVADPTTGFLVVGCDDGIAVSEDGGWTWSEVRSAPVSSGGQRIMAEPGIDSAGQIWVTFTQGESGLGVAGTPDFGLTWPWVYDLSPTVDAALHALPGCDGCTNATFVWPWLSAGSDGRVAVTWIGAFERVDSGSYTGPWYVFSAFVLDATTEPQVIVSQLTPDPIHVGPICQSGTTCQVSSMQGEDRGDRRLGDFFETTIDADGYLHGAWSNTFEAPQDTISHPQYVRQTGGVRLIADDLLGSFMPTQG